MRWVCPPTVDGNTRYRVDGLDVDKFGPTFAQLVAALRAPVDRRRERAWRAAGGRRVRLPIPAGAGAPPWPSCAVSVSGARRHVLAFHVEGHCFVRLNVEQGEAELQMRARVLWREGPERALAWWLAAWGYLLLGHPVDADVMRKDERDGCSFAHRMGWRTTGVEVCADYVGAPFHRDDVGSFVGVKSVATVGEQVSTRGPILEPTIELGGRGSPWSICIYNKTAQVDAAKGGDSSTYAATWRSFGWEEDGDDVRRVEVRATGRGLAWHCPETGEVFSMRDPAQSVAPHMVAMLWSVVTTKKRLVVGDASRSERARLDPRWAAVQWAAGVEPPPPRRFAQARQMRVNAAAAARAKAIRAMLRASMRIAALRGDLPADAESVEGAVRSSVSEALDHLTPAEFAALADYAEAYHQRAETEFGDVVPDAGRTFEGPRPWLPRHEG